MRSILFFVFVFSLLSCSKLSSSRKISSIESMRDISKAVCGQAGNQFTLTRTDLSDPFSNFKVTLRKKNKTYYYSDFKIEKFDNNKLHLSGRFSQTEKHVYVQLSFNESHNVEGFYFQSVSPGISLMSGVNNPFKNCTEVVFGASPIMPEAPSDPIDFNLSKMCYADNLLFKNKTDFQAKDGCNDCTCVDGNFQCTEIGCEKIQQPKGCLINNQFVVPEGVTIDHQDGCNSCTCRKGSMSCTEIGC